MVMKSIRLIITVLLVAFVNLPVFSLTPSITNKGWGAPPKIVTYPHGSPPPALKDYEASCQPEFKGGGQYKYVCKDGKIWVTNLQLEISGSSTITLPDNYNQALKDHEMGHYYLNRLEYNRYAEEKLNEIFKDFGKPRNLSPLEDCDDAVYWLKLDFDQLVDDWIEAMKTQMEELDEKYDGNDITNHSKGPLSAEEGYEKVKNERLKAERKKKYGTEDANATPHPDPKVGPNWNKPVISGEGTIRFDPNSILFDPPGIDVNNLFDPCDPVNSW